MTYEDIPGWFNYAPLLHAAVARVPAGGVVVEIGCWLGKSTAYLADLVKTVDRDILFAAVDHGFGSEDKSAGLHADVLAECGGNTAGRLAANLKACGVVDSVLLIVAPSVRAARLFSDGSVDFAFVDGDHRPESVRADIEAWWPKVKPGGVLAGHDYDHHWPELKAAVTDHFGRDVSDPTCPHCWSVTK